MLSNNVDVKGLVIDDQTRCKHWHSILDIIAVKFACCGEYYACFDCHALDAGHPAKVWAKADFDTEKVVLCGNCGLHMTVSEYMKSGSKCPNCDYPFNPRCELHWHLYFESAGLE